MFYGSVYGKGRLGCWLGWRFWKTGEEVKLLFLVEQGHERARKQKLLCILGGLVLSRRAGKGCFLSRFDVHVSFKILLVV